ncbi:hypothetical protein [Pontibacter actiniarum]|uniref:Uncharacterized protein n=1 Tax=Pontibacter actiniarum TaxID=323450 RepID=A0A1X9YT34_9BACT|nr:hypothetical protein [Pontibacter actiniarum]ARS36022.1 hypothetical protein CA264_11580 [Pontibacter actiniarum]
MEHALWYLLLLGHWGKRRCSITDFYAYGNYLGEAIHHVKARAKVLGLSDCQLLEATRVETFSSPDPIYSIRLSNGVFVGKGISSFTVSPDTVPFLYPTGIVQNVTDGLLELRDAEDTYTASMCSKWHVVRSQLQKVTFEQIFYKVLDIVPQVQQVCLTVRDYNGEGRGASKWIKKIEDKHVLLSLIKDNSKDILENGFVEFEVYTPDGETCLGFDKYRHLLLKTQHKAFYQLYLLQLQSFKVQEVETISLPDSCQYYCHYRPFESLVEKEFKNLL